MEANLDLLDRSFDEWHVTEASFFGTTFQAMNALRLEELYEYTSRFKRIRRLPHPRALARTRDDVGPGLAAHIEERGYAPNSPPNGSIKKTRV